MDKTFLRNVEGYTNVNCLILKTQQTDLRSVFESFLLALVLKSHYINNDHVLNRFSPVFVLTWAQTTPLKAAAGWGRGLAQWAQWEVPPCRSRACALRTDRPPAPQREVRGSREAVSGASVSEPQSGPGAREGSPAASGASGQVGSASWVGTSASEKWRFRFWKHYWERVWRGGRWDQPGGKVPGVCHAPDALWASGRRSSRRLGLEMGPRICSLMGGIWCVWPRCAVGDTARGNGGLGSCWGRTGNKRSEPPVSQTRRWFTEGPTSNSLLT